MDGPRIHRSLGRLVVPLVLWCCGVVLSLSVMVGGGPKTTGGSDDVPSLHGNNSLWKTLVVMDAGRVDVDASRFSRNV